ncbi:MAG: thioesterase domain-containing protein [Xanthomonadales bacterium]|nr:thioesterase domain-containing protein [Xanthomonadales bacterium]
MTPAQLQQFMLDTIPMARAMELAIDRFDGDQLILSAPLAANSNDKGCAFGGSLVSLMTLAGWSLANLLLGDDAASAEIYVQDSQVRYLAPVWERLVVQARLAPGHDAEEWRGTWLRHGRSRLAAEVVCRLADGSVATTLAARFVAIDPRRRRPVAAAASQATAGQ